MLICSGSQGGLPVIAYSFFRELLVIQVTGRCCNHYHGVWDGGLLLWKSVGTFCVSLWELSQT